MPIYQYKCKKCEHIINVRAKMADLKPLFCQKCGAENTLEKQIVSTSFHLDGGGWYDQGYTGGGSKKSTNSEF